MKNFELDEQKDLPIKYKPLTAWEYFGYSILYSVPLIGFICLIINCFSDKNINRRSYSRSFFCGLIIVLILVGIYMGLISTGVLIGGLSSLF